MPFVSAWRKDPSEFLDIDNQDKIHYSIGQPSKSFLQESWELISTSQHDLFEKSKKNEYDHRLMLNYGDSDGNIEVLKKIAQFLSFEYNEKVIENELFISNGNSQGLEICCSVLLNNNDNKIVFVEDPTFFLSLNTLRNHGAKIVGVKVDKNGMNIDDVKEKIKLHGSPAFIYTIPSFHNPTGTTLTHERRQELVDLCIENDIMIVSDDVYQMLWFNEKQKPPKLLNYYSNNKCTISLGTFSKILAPGLRLGWIQSHPEIIEKFSFRGFVCSGGCLNNFTAGLVANLITENGLSNHIVKLRSQLNERKMALCNAIEEKLSSICSLFHVPCGGYFIYVEVNEKYIEEILLLNFVSFTGGNRCSVDGGTSRMIRLCFAYYESKTLVEGIDKISKALAIG